MAFFQSASNVLGKFFSTRKMFQISLTVIFAVVLIGLPLYYALKSWDLAIFLKGFGDITLGIDHKLQEGMRSIVETGWSASQIFVIIAALWFYYIMIRIFYWLWDKMSVHGAVIVLFLAVLSVAALQSLYMTSLTGKLYTPLQGLWYFFQHLTYVLDPSIERLKPLLAENSSMI